MAIDGVSQPLSFVSCIGRFAVPTQPAAAARCHSVRVQCNIALEVSKTVSRKKRQGIELTAKEMRHLWKKEIQKENRREKKEKEKAERVIYPVWYGWSEEDVYKERSKLTAEEGEEDTTDDFLSLIGDELPARRIVMEKQIIVDAGNPAKTSRKAAARQRRPASRINISSQQMELSSSRDWKAVHRERLQEFAENSLVEQNSIIRDQETEGNFTDTLTNISNSSAVRPPAEQFRCSAGINEMAAPRDECGNENDIEKFLDSDDEDVLEEKVVWVNRNGRLKRKKPPATKEFKEMLLSRRKGDLTYMKGDEMMSESTEDDILSAFEFDGRSMLAEDKKIQKLAARLNETNYWTSKFQFGKLMHDGRLKMTEDRVIRIVQILGELGNWRRAMQVVQWVHRRQRYMSYKSRYIFTTLLAVLGKAHRPVEALNVFAMMREELSSYPDMAAYHTMAVTLGQAGYLKELLYLIEVLKDGPKKLVKNVVPSIRWDPCLLPDIVVYNAVLNACIPSKDWSGVLWTWDQFEKQGISPNSATFGLTIEAMVKAEKFEQAIRFYRRMERAGCLLNAQTYKCLAEIFGRSGKPDEAIELVKQMEASGIIGTASVYYALACSLCISGRLQEALDQVRKMQQFSSKKPDFITYTGLIMTCKKAGRIWEAIYLFKHMQDICAPNVDTCNVMIKIYGQSKMFAEARTVYEAVKKGWIGLRKLFNNVDGLRCNSLTFESMLKASAASGKWDYFDSVYKEMTSQGYHLCESTSLWLMLKVANEGKIVLVDDMIRRLHDSGEVPDLRLYKAQILQCLHQECTHKAVGYINDMARDGYEVASTIQSIQKYVHIDIWKTFSLQCNHSTT